MVLMVKNLPAIAGDAWYAGLIPGSGRSPAEGMATYCSILAWRIPWTGAWWGMIHRLTRSWTRLKHLNSSIWWSGKFFIDFLWTFIEAIFYIEFFILVLLFGDVWCVCVRHELLYFRISSLVKYSCWFPGHRVNKSYHISQVIYWVQT